MNRKIEIAADLFSICGYGKFSRNIVEPLLNMNSKLVFENFEKNTWKDRIENVSFNFHSAKLEDDMLLGSLCIVHPKDFSAHRLYGRHVLFNTSLNFLSKDEIEMLKLSESIFATGSFTEAKLLEAGFKKEKIKIIPPCLKKHERNNIGSFSFSSRRKYCFFSTVSAVNDKNWEDLVWAFINAFDETEDVCLLLKVVDVGDNIFEYNELIRKMDFMKRSMAKDSAPIILINRNMSDLDMTSVYNRADCFVKLDSFGLGLSMLEAFSYGLTCIAPEFGDCRDYLNRKNSFIIDKIGEEKVGLGGFESVTKNKYDRDQLSSVMRYACYKHENVKEKSRKERKVSLSSFSDSKVAYEILMKLRNNK
jgi:glycosyltransferase involved in cell wall biosynthesis